MSTAESSHAAKRRRWSFPIARVAGIQIRVHLTFFLLVPFFAWAGTQAGGPGVAGSLAWLPIIFVCVVLHELGHCLVGRLHGIDVHEIDLLPIGGVSQLERLPERGRDEFAMALAGPLVSVAIAFACMLIAIAAGVPLTPVDWFDGPIITRLVWFNLLIGAFNLLPALPLDGGRVLRALLERTRTLEDATRIAAKVGRHVAIAIAIAGAIAAPLLVLIAVFIYVGASAEEAATIIHVRLERHTIGELMARGPEDLEIASRLGDTSVVDVHDALEACVPKLVASPDHALVVTDDNRIVGVLRHRDVDRLVNSPAGKVTADRAMPQPSHKTPVRNSRTADW